MKGPGTYGYPGEVWTARRLIPVVKQEFGVEYGERGMLLLLLRLLHRIGFASRVPRPRHPKAASERKRRSSSARSPASGGGGRAARSA